MRTCWYGMAPSPVLKATKPQPTSLVAPQASCTQNNKHIYFGISTWLLVFSDLGVVSNHTSGSIHGEFLCISWRKVFDLVVPSLDVAVIVSSGAKWGWTHTHGHILTNISVRFCTLKDHNKKQWLQGVIKLTTNLPFACRGPMCIDLSMSEQSEPARHSISVRTCQWQRVDSRQHPK